MNSLTILGYLLRLTIATNFKVINQCICDQLLSLTDCKDNPGCSWSTRINICSARSGTTSEGYCTLITDSSQCAKTKGCAYIDSACVIFAGCTAYKGATDAECQFISKFCNSDGVAFCVAPEKCSSYKTEESCASKVSSAGFGTCVWDSGCRDKKCTEAEAQLNSNTLCNNFINGCLSNGKGCVVNLGLCSTYTGDVDSCEGLIGSDGYCKGVDGGTKCQAKVCTDADTSLTTDSACAGYQIGCVTTGYGCGKSPLGACSALTGDDVICANKRGSDGKCKGVAEGNTCSVVACSDASDTLSTDDDCDAFKKGCVTTGKGCVTSRGACSTYKGISTTCDGYIGSDGKCKGASDEEASCSPKVCKGADASLKTDEQCNNYQYGCKTTGKGCTAILSTCSSYTGDSKTCDGHVGTDGKCKGGTSFGPCSAKVCTEAATTLTTNEECVNYQIGCIASQTGGCIAAGACSTLILSTQCYGKSTCQWTPQCVKNVACSDLTTEILCKTVKLQNGSTCWWSAGSCIARVCTQAPATYDSDSLCDSFLKGCLTKKTGCLAPTDPCTSYSGSKATCEGFTLKCTNADGVSESTACTNITCAGNTTATSDDACNSHHKGCLTKGTGCIDPSEACTAYPGTSTDICGKFTGSSGANKCWWITGGTTCVNKACTQADATLTSDGQCEIFLTGCVTTSAGCKANTTACSGYTGTQAVCGALTKGCTRSEACTAEKTCAQISNPTTQQSCEDVLPGVCMFVKDKCMTIGACNTYTNAANLTPEICGVLKNSSGASCYWTAGTSCADRDCSQFTGTGLTLTQCQTFKDDCIPNAAKTACETVTCSNATTKTNEYDCTQYHPNCHFYQTALSTNSCIASVNCSDMTMFPDTGCVTAVTKSGAKCKAPGSGNTCVDSTCDQVTSGATDCNEYKIKLAGNLNVSVWNCVQNSATCEARDCTKAAAHLGVAISTPSQCMNYFEACVMTYNAGTAECKDGYTGTGATQFGCGAVSGLATQCPSLYGRYKTAAGVYYYQLCKAHASATAAACLDRVCVDIDGKTDAICQAYLPTCKSNGTSCVNQSDACNTFSSTAEGCANFQGVTAGSKCQQTPSNSPAACTDRACYHNGTATTDTDCDKYLEGCITNGKGCVDGATPCTGQYGNQDGCKALTGNGKKCWSTSTTTKGPCIDRTCSHNTTATTDDDCDTFLRGCVTKGTGCIEKSAECSSYQGTQTDSEKFTGNGKSCTNDTTATATTACKTKDCTKLTADSYSEDVCQAYGKQCHYNGNKCDVKSTCSSMKGNFITCAIYVANDGPCKGTALQTETPTNCSAATCADAPITFTTNDECDKYKTGCVTNGRGCATSVNCKDVQNESSCLAVKSGSDNICTWAFQCRDVQTGCSNFTSSGSSVCLSSKVTSGFGICVWKYSVCTESTCEDLPLTIGSEEDCTGYSNTCTFGGTNQGCVTKGYCTSYKTKENCSNAKSKDKIGACTWDETVTSGTNIVGCRAKDCQDAATSISDDTSCEAFISGCKTNGAGCMTPPFGCSDFKTQAKCLQDSTLQPCLWYNNGCSQYYKCEDLPLKTVLACSAISKYCTTDDSKCIALKTCANYTKQSQCVIGTDGSCGWVTSTKKCYLYTQCTDLVSKVNTECQAFNQKCISNGVNCIDIGECSSYGDSETACKLGGTDGTCFFDKDSTSCRLRQCSDSTTSTSTHNGCYGYQINGSTKCTTDGSTCIALADCSTYKQVGCVIDANFNACIYDTTSQACKQKVCTDIKKTKSSDCAAALYGCISNGTNCISKAKCETYTTKESCNAGGLDGSCAFTPESNSETSGTCKLFSQCSDANSDQTACQIKSTACKWTAKAGITTSSCSIHTCDTAAKGTTQCLAFPNFDSSQITVCIISGGKCIVGDPSALTQDNCYKMSQYNYSWNEKTNKCVACGGGKSVINNTVRNNTNGSNSTSTNTTNNGKIYSLLATVLFLIL